MRVVLPTPWQMVFPSEAVKRWSSFPLFFLKKAFMTSAFHLLHFFDFLSFLTNVNVYGLLFTHTAFFSSPCLTVASVLKGLDTALCFLLFYVCFTIVVSAESADSFRNYNPCSYVAFVSSSNTGRTVQELREIRIVFFGQNILCHALFDVTPVECTAHYLGPWRDQCQIWGDTRHKGDTH